MFLQSCDCGAYAGHQYFVRLGPPRDPNASFTAPVFAAMLKIARCPHVESTGWGQGGMYEHVALLVNAQLWDLLHSGLGLAENVVHCRVCERFDDLTNYSERRPALFASRLCFYCGVWQERLAHRGLPHFIADGVYYKIGEEPRRGTPDHCLGFGGAKWIIEHDGKEIRTRNLWRKGEVPPHWRDQFPDTAVLKQDRGGPSPAFVGDGGP